VWQAYRSNEHRDSPHIEFASETICSCRRDALNGDASDKVKSTPKRNVGCIDSQCSCDWILHCGILSDKSAVRDDTTNDRVGVTCVTGNIEKEFCRNKVVYSQSSYASSETTEVQTPEFPDALSSGQCRESGNRGSFLANSRVFLLQHNGCVLLVRHGDEERSE
jgi:hypothetical protein